MKYIDVCSGISAPTMAWKPRGWQALCYAEIADAPRAVLAHHYPEVPLRSDFTDIRGDEYGSVDLLVGGTPCQSFSLAGLRGGLADGRGNLSLEFLKLAKRSRARWLVWENVPGVLSSNGGRDFGAILGGLVELGYGFPYRVLDAQYFGVPQRRRRVFLVGHFGDWRRAAAVLFERHCLSGSPAPLRQSRQVVSALTANGVGTCGADDNQGQSGHLIPAVASTLTATYGEQSGQDMAADGLLIAHTLRGAGFDASEDGTGRGTPIVPVEVAPTLTSNSDGHSGYRDEKGLVPVGRAGVRRLTPRECERLQGFPDDFTLVPYRGRKMADGPRYKMLGNSWAVPCADWIGGRIGAVDALETLPLGLVA